MIVKEDMEDIPHDNILDEICFTCNCAQRSDRNTRTEGDQVGHEDVCRI